jgi:putative solute:sodium symporter small subunit
MASKHSRSPAFRTLRLLWTALLVWLVLGFAIHLLVSPLNQLRIIGYPAGYFMAAQGSIFGLVLLVIWFARRQDRIDRDYIQSRQHEPPRPVS